MSDRFYMEHTFSVLIGSGHIVLNTRMMPAFGDTNHLAPCRLKIRFQQRP